MNLSNHYGHANSSISGQLPPAIVNNGTLNDTNHVINREMPLYPPMTFDPGTQNFLLYMDRYFTPAIVIFGVVTNILSTVVFQWTKLRIISSVHYLTAIAVCDCLYLLTHLSIWVSNMFDFYNLKGWCQMITYCNNVSLSLSMWCAVALVVEKCISVCFCDKKSEMCTAFRAKVVIIVLSIFTCACYLYITWIWVSKSDSGIRTCIIEERNELSFNILNKMDAFIVFVIPYLVILVGDCLLCLRSYQEFRLRQSLQSLEANLRLRTNQSVRGNPSENITKVTPLVLVVTIVSLALKTPQNIARVRMQFHVGAPLKSDVLLHEFGKYFYVMSFALNFVLYIAFSPGFRKGAINLISRRRNDSLRDSEDNTRSRDVNFLHTYTIEHGTFDEA